MVKKQKDGGRGEDEATLKIPPRKNDKERLQAAMEARGFSPDQFTIKAVERKHDGQGRGKIEYEMALNLSDGEAERLIKLLTIKPFDPDKDTVSIGKAEVGLVSAKEVEPKPQATLKIWTGKERGRRSKPKRDVPDID